MNSFDTNIIRLCSEAACLVHSGNEKILLISDIHIGWESSLAEKGLYLPSLTDHLIKNLILIARREKPDSLVILGDVKHSIPKIQIKEWEEVPRFFEKVSEIFQKIEVIPGNHDGNIEAILPKNVLIAPVRGKNIGNVGLFHGHTWPDLKLLGCRTFIVGHTHPIIIIRDSMGFRLVNRVWVKIKCDSNLLTKLVLEKHGFRFKKRENIRKILMDNYGIDLAVEELIIMPSFNNYLGGQILNFKRNKSHVTSKGFMGPVLLSGSMDLENAEIFLLDGTFMGSIRKLTELSQDTAN